MQQGSHRRFIGQGEKRDREGSREWGRDLGTRVTKEGEWGRERERERDRRGGQRERGEVRKAHLLRGNLAKVS